MIRMDRLEKIRMDVDHLISELADENDRKFAYLHLYSVSECATMLAIARHVDFELLAIAGMLHDISLYAFNSGHKDHARKSAEYAKVILERSNLFQEDEIKLITHCISLHSDKQSKSDGVYAEILKDADILSQYLYNPNIPVHEEHRVRLYYLLESLKQLQKK